MDIGGGRVVDLAAMRQARADDRSRTRPVRRSAAPVPAASAGAATTSPAAATSPPAASAAAGNSPGSSAGGGAAWLWQDRGVWKPYSPRVTALLNTAHAAGEERADIDDQRCAPTTPSRLEMV